MTSKVSSAPSLDAFVSPTTFENGETAAWSPVPLDATCQESPPSMPWLRHFLSQRSNPHIGFVHDDAGRMRSGINLGRVVGDCVCRAITIASGEPYAVVYRGLLETRRKLMRRSRYALRSHPKTGMYRIVYDRYLLERGWKWVPCMRIGTGCKVHLRANELPRGRLVVSVSQHITAVIDGVIHDITDPSRNGTRCVYGYYYHPKHQTETDK